MKKKKVRHTAKLKWGGINELDIATLVSMSLDGYCFCINDGEIKRLLMKTRVQA